MDIQSAYQKAIKFATLKHVEKEQLVPGSKLPYVVHLSNVAMEIFLASQQTKDFDLIVAIQIALLHDTIEDTDTTFEELVEEFGAEVATAVAALTKNDDLPKSEKMMDSLTRIKKLKKEAWAVKMADRITNLQRPPAHWNDEKKTEYLSEALIIVDTLKGGNPYLENRLLAKISEYNQYIG